MPPLDVVIVEAHHHCLEHIHAILRKKKIFRPWSMLHLDAHPDLACPTVPATACFTPRQAFAELTSEDRESSKDLYELLDSTASGIAEWILPLVLAAQLQTIEWIKPKFSKQIPCGHHQFHVGAFEPSPGEITEDKPKPAHFCDLSIHAQLKVDWSHPYYLDDDSVVLLRDLELPQTLNLHVTELEQVNHSAIKMSDLLRKSSMPWILDICLDYFACWNPYLTDIDSVDPDLTVAFLRVMTESNCFQKNSSSANNPPSDLDSSSYRQRLRDFRLQLQGVLTDEATVTPLGGLTHYYSSPKVCETSIRRLQELVRPYGERALNPILEAIPFWNMPHAQSTAQKDPIDAIVASIERVERMLEQLLDSSPSASAVIPPPFLVTIARSTCDGFTPTNVVEEIQERILAMLHKVFCVDCTKHCALSITKDYGEWEGSTIV